METHPPKLIEDFFGALIPPACREHVLGDWHERFTSRSQYISDAITTLPFLIASQVRRTFRIELFLAEACAAYIAFGVASFRGGPGYLYDQRLLLPLTMTIGVVLLALVLGEAYREQRSDSPRKICVRVAIGLALGFVAQNLIGLVNSNLTLPSWLMARAIAIGFPMLVIVQTSFGKIPSDSNVVATGGAMSLDQLRQRSQAEHRKAWHVNFAWLAAALLVLATLSWNPFPSAQSYSIGFMLVMFVVIGIFLKFGQYKQGKAFRQPSPASINSSRWWLSLAAVIALALSWIYVRRVNGRAAHAIQQEIDALDASEKKE